VGSTFGNRPIAVKVSAVSDPFPAAVKVGLGSTWAEPRRRANGRNRRNGVIAYEEAYLERSSAMTIAT
jgi:hypothetical protein